MKFLPKTMTGISGLDEITMGGIPQGRPTLICGGPGCGKTLFSIEFLVNGVTRFNEPGVFIAFEEKTEELTTNVASLGFDLEKLQKEKKLKKICILRIKLLNATRNIRSNHRLETIISFYDIHSIFLNIL